MSRSLVLFAVLGAAAFAQKPYSPAKTPWGDPDLQGVWPGTDMIGTPMERPRNFGTRNILTDEEYAQRQARAQNQSNIDSQETVNDVTRCDPNRGGLGNTPTTCSNGVSIGPPLYWDDRGKPNRQASFVVDPPDGRIPQLTAAAQKLQSDRAAARTARPCSTQAGGCHDSWEDESLWDRCITRGVTGSIVPNTYNQGNQIIQTPGYVILRNEMIHETRVIPVGGGPHAPSSIRTWMGDSRGRWEGNALVVETTNLNGRDVIAGTAVSDEIRLIERFTRTDLNTLEYRLTIDDPKTWIKPWTISFPLRRDSNYTLYEYACHEGNYYMRNALSGARKAEQK
ncbi:MAG: hypothetical protein JO307_12275 [Bryobacterales bacterium]|nr:hypothetical protein [Bryobacterales bacterium]MBV9399788.1 hypothetical protein [Bryobacterales bacterium]